MSDPMFFRLLTKPKGNLEHNFIDYPFFSNSRENRDPMEHWKMNLLSHGQSLKFQNQDDTQNSMVFLNI